MGIYKSWNEPRLRLTDGAITKRDQGENGINEQGVTDQSIDELNNNPNFVKNNNNDTGNTKISWSTQPTSGESNERIAEISLLTGTTNESGKSSLQGVQSSKSKQ